MLKMMKMKNDYLLVKRLVNNLHGSLWIPTTESREAIVLKNNSYLPVSENDIIVTTIGMSTKYIIEDQEYEAIHAEQVLAKIER